MAKTESSVMFAKSKNSELHESQIETHFQRTNRNSTIDEFKSHKYIKLKLKDKLLLFFHRVYGLTCLGSVW